MSADPPPNLSRQSPSLAELPRSRCGTTLEHMDVIARAITPAYRTRRFDTRFFMIHDQFIFNDPEQISDASGELNELVWLTLNEARQLDLPR